MENERQEFECRIAGYDLTLRLGNCAIVMFRTQQEVDYLAVDLEDEEAQTLRVFNNIDLARWMAGYRLKEKEGNLFRNAVLSHQDNHISFRELTGWNPPVIEKEFPTETELEYFMEVNTDNIDQEWQRMGE